jgi:hypothetical protein
MGFKKPERRTAEYWRGHAETVTQMVQQHWDVTTECAVCRLAMRVDLALVAKVARPDVSLWNRRQPCRRLGCEGFVTFYGRPPELLRPIPLVAAWPSGKPPRWWEAR